MTYQRPQLVLHSLKDTTVDFVVYEKELLPNKVKVCPFVLGSPSVLTKSLHWSRPILSWIKGNVNASVHTTNGLAAIGGVIRDEHGNWIVRFTRPVGRCSVLLAELWALHNMLARAWSFGFRRVVIKTDCLEAIQILQRSSNSLSVVASIRLWIVQNWELVVCYSSRICNLLADKLAAWGRLNSQDVLTLPSPPSSLLAVVEADKNSTRLDPLELQDYWSREPNGIYSKKVFCEINSMEGAEYDIFWKEIWSNLAPPKIETFVWKAIHQIIPTKMELAKREVVMSDAINCPICGTEPEQ
ncbi:hypothetical protein GQ457_03G023890 [Hibiscus cannabinus]